MIQPFLLDIASVALSYMLQPQLFSSFICTTRPLRGLELVSETRVLVAQLVSIFRSDSIQVLVVIASFPLLVVDFDEK